MKSTTPLLCVSLLILFSATTVLAAEEEYRHPDPRTGYSSIFSGQDLDGWTMQWQGIWDVQRGSIVGKQDPASGGDSWLFTDEEWDDFSLELEFNMTPNCNSGVGIRMPAGTEGRPSQYGYEIQISDIDEEFPTGSVFRHTPANQKLHNVEQWNEMAIICVKDHIVVYLNRQKVVDTRLEGSKKGRVGLQVHGGETFKDQVVRFRNVRIKDLKPQSDVAESPVKFKVHPIDSDIQEGAEVVDIDKDGILDITCGPNWYKGPDWKPVAYREVSRSGEFANNYGEIAMDVNGDGWMDIISGGWFDPILAWYENPGDPAQHEGLWEKHVITADLPGTETIVPCDLNNDGRMDILANRYFRTVSVRYFENVGTDKNPSGFIEHVIGAHGRGHGMGAGDVNGDGKDDIITPDGWYEGTAGWAWHDDTFEAHEGGIPILVDDFNEDGLNDLIAGEGHHFGLRWWEQVKDSAGNRGWIRHEIDDSYSQLHTMVLADLDNDGTKDFITGKRYRGHNGSDPGANEPLCVFWYKIEKGKAPKFTKYIASYDENIGVGADLSAIDIDKDGDIDLVCPGKSGLYLLENLLK